MWTKTTLVEVVAQRQVEGDARCSVTTRGNETDGTTHTWHARSGDLQISGEAPTLEAAELRSVAAATLLACVRRLAAGDVDDATIRDFVDDPQGPLPGAG